MLKKSLYTESGVPVILPPLTSDAKLEVISLFQLAKEKLVSISTPPYRNPHHSASSVAIIGGGSYPRPGEISLAHRGVLFLDEMSEFPKKTLDMLRQPLETGKITICRAQSTVSYPAQFILIAAMNPCPCGYRGSNAHYCTCTPKQIQAYLELKVPLIQAVDRIQQFFEDRNGIQNIQMGLFKLEIQDYPINVFQEALLNAISHRDYESTSSIFVKFYPNEIIVENPGSFPSGVDSTNIITHPSSPRNKLIAETLQKLRYVQRSGQGVDIIFKDMLSLGKSAPEYNLYSEAVSLTLRSSLEDIEFLKFITKEEENNGEFSVSEICILKYIKSNKTINLGKAAEVAQITTQSATNVLNKLCQKRNILQREARNKYMFTHRVYENLDDNIEYTKDKDFDEIQAKTMIIDYLNKNGLITRSDVERLCGFSSTSSKRILQRLRDEEIIVLEGRARASYYKLK